ncbi:Uncharacterised protein [Zhongshania aliphaticivorans]|uniref:Signaling pathway modulator ZraP n=1 Tax=Zhongshania aliphaticivorans TaxID=1470434 RepID=A0A5S9NUF7_9GAMM|nr:periplasmic heavy metal sensor [Zhongshania aliphaticivorans]CAA0094257.1 Uncharacterised protein [Zhongshania aliphaticivorans]CAA0112337.1 Uncharacterised protein [Zhongshania aliphaticivorans]
MSARRSLLIALFVSLVLNGVLVGSYIGHRLMGEERQAMHGMTKQLLKDEPNELAEPMRQVLELHRGDMAKAYRELRKAKREMGVLLKQEQITEGDISNGFAAIRQADDHLKAVSHEVLATILARLPPEQRVKFALRELGRMQKKPPKPQKPGSPPKRDDKPSH